MEVAVVDFHASDAAAAFTESLRGTGFAVVTNHPLDWSMVDSIYREWDRFFDSGSAEAYTTVDLRNGYFPARRAETATAASVRDLKEYFHLHDDTPLPREVSAAVHDYRRAATAVAQTLLGWVQAHTPTDVAARLSMPLPDMTEGSIRSLLRVLRYPPLPVDVPDGAVRAAAHEDINLLTILPASNESGLELLGTDGTWYPVPTDPGSIAVNGGEMLDLATGGYYPATTHRVVNPIGDAASRARMALPLFLHPRADVVLAEGRTAAEYLDQRIAELAR